MIHHMSGGQFGGPLVALGQLGLQMCSCLKLNFTKSGISLKKKKKNYIQAGFRVYFFTFPHLWTPLN